MLIFPQLCAPQELLGKRTAGYGLFPGARLLAANKDQRWGLIAQ